MVDKKYIKLGVAALAVVGLVIGLSVGITQSQKNNNVSAAKGSANQNVNVLFDEDCPSAKSGKSGGRNRRHLVVPGTEDYEPSMVSPAQRRKLRNDLKRKLQGTDDGWQGAAEAAGAGTYTDGSYSKAGKSEGGSTYTEGAAGKSGKSGSGSYSKSGKSGTASSDACRSRTKDVCETGYTGKSGKSGNKSGKSGGGGKSGKSGSGECNCPGNKSGKSGGDAAKSGKSGADGMYGDGEYANASKSGKSGNKSGKSGSYGECPCNPQPTLCPTHSPPCDCKALPFIVVGGVCARGCEELIDGDITEYNTMEECCVDTVGEGGECIFRDQCPPGTPEPTYAPTALEPTYDPTHTHPDPTYNPTAEPDISVEIARVTDAPTKAPTNTPTDAPTECVCEDQAFAFIGGECTRGCGISTSITIYNTRERCCMSNFQATDSTCTTYDTCCDCEQLPVAYVNGQCVKGCGLSESGTYDSIGECCVENFGFTSGNCMTNDECPIPTPSPTQGSTPTVSTEATGPPTRAGRSTWGV